MTDLELRVLSVGFFLGEFAPEHWGSLAALAPLLAQVGWQDVVDQYDAVHETLPESSPLSENWHQMSLNCARLISALERAEKGLPITPFRPGVCELCDASVPEERLEDCPGCGRIFGPCCKAPYSYFAEMVGDDFCKECE